MIGYITNALAIKMLFRPYEAKYFMGFKLPFTPGIIPKEKGRIAASLGGAISDNLMSPEVLEKNLLSPEMVGKVRGGVADFLLAQKENPETLREFLVHYLGAEGVDSLLTNIRGEFSSQLAVRLADSDLGDQIADVVVSHVQSKLRIDGLDIDIPSMVKSLLGKTIWGALADMIASPAKSFLASNINRMLSDHGTDIVSGLYDKEVGSLLATPMSELFEGRDGQIARFADAVAGLYSQLIREQLPKILATINIPAIIESRINEMDMRETETLIFQVMDKELKAIVWLGAGLGLIMGFLNPLLSKLF